MKTLFSIVAMLALSSASIAQQDAPKPPKSIAAPPNTPSFTLAWSEYPSWSAFDVASSVGLIDGRKGYLGSVESAWGVDIELKLMDYDPCIQAYSGSNVDAVCITNIDILSPSLTRRSVAIMPTSTSFGGDALVVAGGPASLDEIKGYQVFGLSKSVSEFAFDGILEANKTDATKLGLKFVNMDPGAAATAMQQKDEKVKAIMVWNPFILQTLKLRKDAKVIGNSAQIPLQIIDMVVVGEDVLKRQGGASFAKCIADTFYRLNVRLNDSNTQDDTLIAIGEKFSSLNLEQMRKVVTQTLFFGSSREGIRLFGNSPTSVSPGSDPTNLKDIMTKVVARCVKLEMVPSKVVIGYGSDAEAMKANLRFDPQYMQAVANLYDTDGKPRPVVPVDAPLKRAIDSGTK